MKKSNSSKILCYDKSDCLLAEEQNKFIKLSDRILSSVNNLERLCTNKKDARGFSTGIDSIDNIIGDLRKGEMIVIASEPSVGKTSLALNVLKNIAIINKIPGALFSLEMSVEQISQRMLYSLAEITEKDFYNSHKFDKARFKENWKKITSACSKIKNSDVFINGNSNLCLDELASKAQYLTFKHGIEFLVIDYIQLINTEIEGNYTRQDEIERISAGIKFLALELNIPIIVTAQLTRQDNSIKNPVIPYLKELKTIEQAADIVIIMHNKIDPENFQPVKPLIELVIAKNRNGQTGKTELIFLPEYMNFQGVLIDA